MYVLRSRVAVLRMKVTHVSLVAIVTMTSIIFMAVSSSAQPAGQKMTLDALMKRHLDALGGRDAVQRINSLRLTGAFESDGHNCVMVETDKLPSKQYSKVTFGPFTMLNVFDGKIGWQFDPERHLSHDDDMLKGARFDLYLKSHVYALGGPAKGKVILRAAREADTGDYIVDVKADGFPSAALFFDPQTYLITKAKQEGSVFAYSGYQKFDGILFPTVEKDIEADPSDNATYTVTNIETNILVADSLFETPKDTKPAEPDLAHKY
jgi:hypothetical protein